MNIIVLGAGTFGTAIANELSVNTQNKVILFSRNEKKVWEINDFHTNKSCFPNKRLSENLNASSKTSIMKNADVIILDSLRIKPHISHFNLEQSVSLLQELKPKKALLTHISHYMGLQARVNELLPKNISLSFDRQSIVL